MTDAAALAGLADLDQALVPDLLREAARTLAAVAEENVEREDGFYAGDRIRLLAPLEANRPSRPATREPIMVRPRIAEAGPREQERVMAAPVADETLLFVAGGPARGGPAATEPPSRAIEPAPPVIGAVARWTPPAQVATTVTVPSQAVESERPAPPASQADTVPALEPVPAPAVVPAAAPTAPADASDVLEQEAAPPGPARGHNRAGRPAAEAAPPGATTGRAPPGQERRDRPPAAAHPRAVSRSHAR